MATLKECVESGRRWRHRTESAWKGPGLHQTTHPYDPLWVRAESALSNEWEIEPEPEKPREWILHTIPSRAPSWHALPCSEYGCPRNDIDRIRVHDADACDQLHAEGRSWHVHALDNGEIHAANRCPYTSSCHATLIAVREVVP